MNKGLFLFSLLLLTGLLNNPVWAACNATMQNASFGSQTSFVINSTVQTTSANLVVTCGIVLASLLTTDTISAKLNSASSSSGTQAAMKNTANADLEPINMCKASNCTPTTPIGSTINYSSTDLINLLGGNVFTIPIYFKTTTGQNLSAGTYNVTLNLTINWNICGLLGVGNVCLNQQTGSTTLSPTVTLIVTNDCSTITAPNIDFGSAPLVNSFPNVSQTISITCTKGSLYNVGINNGVNAVSNVRNMKHGSGLISYDIYQGTTTTRWGSSGSELWSSANSTTVSADQLTRTYNYVAKVLTGQTTPSQPGSYTDTLVVNVAF
ncbi:spore coat U domain-containing protein [Arsenophonus nasoniae]|uniref:Spore Coat Protein U domain protein n=1 Tax=Arsenophonus nasoniae TaxID=638 RepID=A0A4V1BWB3_9GAMM|nr:spore coat U domain-containing protein [Arsenophonus nasoniae]QBY41593.1 Spore Coat Protein U domain protein [Arsenophonus nasoniae]WGM01530.1 spore coat U domain-containing protein [Arsenophonus nasoniae]WGM05796.1 spore coat U domain-containing protein [Arsenophonus nasoniae]WGM10808.1 spore coat U domain-containing protein [Arsenophonus nasoniae]WGM15515.1 spore coat U domain-containing protein [Arsenophonus nasoniae]